MEQINMNRLVDLYYNQQLGIRLHFPDVNGIFNNGILVAIGSLLNYFFVILVLIFVGYSIYAGFKIIKSQGDSKEIETGINLIKNVWISVAWGIVFFIAISVVGAFLGIGDVTQWYYQLAQCHDASGGFYFRDIAAQTQEGIPATNVFCCKVTSPNSLPQAWREVRFKEGTYHYIASDSGNPPPGVDECVEVK